MRTHTDVNLVKQSCITHTYTHAPTQDKTQMERKEIARLALTQWRYVLCCHTMQCYIMQKDREQASRAKMICQLID